jgi:hypothetical protein
MKRGSAVDDARIEALLASLGQISPATRRRRAPRRVRRLVLVGAVLAVLAGGGAFAATKVFGPLHNAELTPPRTPLTCSGVIGQSADHAAAYFSAHGYQVSWRLMHWGSEVERGGQGSGPQAIGGSQSKTVETPQAIGGSHSDIVETPPPDSVVWDVTQIGPDQVIVQVQAPNDPNAPQLSPPKC